MIDARNVHGTVYFDRHGRYLGHSNASGTYCSDAYPEHCQHCKHIAPILRANRPASVRTLTQAESADLEAERDLVAASLRGLTADDTLTREMRHPAAPAPEPKPEDHPAHRAVVWLMIAVGVAVLLGVCVVVAAQAMRGAL